MTARRRLTALVMLLAVVLVGTVILAGGSGKPRGAAISASQQAAELAGSPAALAGLHAQASRLLGGGPRAFAARLHALHGYPVVVNKWASWCGPCQSEFPAYQRAAAALGKRVAFVGIDGKDPGSGAGAFLRRFPVSYPSYVDPGEAIARTLQAVVYYPETVYIDRSGRQVYDHAGPYASAAALEQDIHRYVLR